jgi:hypothetical protein
MICANKDCAIDFDARTHNQKYCSDECCRLATNKRIMEKYYEKKAIKNGAIRVCKSCSSQLSRYNQDTICATCEKSTELKSKAMMKDILNEIG